MPEKSNANVKASTKKRANVSAEVKVDTKNPIPFELSGNSFYFYEGGERYIPFLDQKDNFFNTLLEAKLLSTTHFSCISTRALYSLGEGLTINELKKDKKLKELDEALDAFFSCCNNAGDSLNDIIKEIYDHLDTFGNVFIEIVRGQVGKDKFVKVYVWNTPECRLSAPKGEDFPTTVIKSKRLLKNGLLTDFGAIVRRPILDRNKPLNKKRWIDEKGSQRTVIFLRNKVAGYPCYGLPESIPSLFDQLVEYRGTRYNLDNLENNCSPGGALGLKGNLTEEEATKQGQKFNKQLVGPGKAGRWIAVASEQGLEGIDIKPFDTKREGSFSELDDKSVKKILMAHRWNKVLAGLDDGAALGKGSGYLKGIFDIALKTVITPRQRFILENFIGPLMTICDDWLGTKWSDYTFQFKNFTPASFITMLKNVDAAVRRNEVRAELGLETDETGKGNEYLGGGAVAKEDPDKKEKEDEDESGK